MSRIDRAEEAVTLVQSLLNRGWTVQQIATETGSTERNVYRWLREGRAPHPFLLDRLRGMAQGGTANEDREGAGERQEGI